MKICVGLSRFTSSTILPDKVLVSIAQAVCTRPTCLYSKRGISSPRIRHCRGLTQLIKLQIQWTASAEVVSRAIGNLSQSHGQKSSWTSLKAKGEGLAWSLAWPNELAEPSLSFISHDNLGGILPSEYLININILDISIYKYSNDNNL